MRIFHQAPPLLILLLLSGFPLGAQDRLSAGGSTNWQGFTSERITFTKGYKGFSDAVLEDSVYKPDPRSDLLMHWDIPGADPTAGAWDLRKEGSLTHKSSKLGGGSAVFQKDGGIVLTPRRGSLFSPGRVWQDFSLEFWLYPAALSENEEILFWKGRMKTRAGFKPQEIRCSVSNRKIIWLFDNFFLDETGNDIRIELEGPQMLPRKWSHHRIRFDSGTGLIEYLIDGYPVDSIHAGPSGREGVDIYLPRIGESSDPLEIGRTFTGFMDELRLTDDLSAEPVLDRFTLPGVLESGIIDLGYPDSDLARIEAVYREPDRSRIYFQYFQTNDRMRLFSYFNSTDPAAKKLEWKEFRPGDTLNRARGQYLIVRIELYPDPAGNTPPSVSELTFVYEPAYPPAPPQRVTAEADGGDIVVRWQKPAGLNIAGYLIYYGDRSGVYHMYDPVDAGNVYEYRLTGLQARKLYYITVVAYTGSVPRQYSPFSKEMAVRP
jgi:hypothetical protein